VDAVFSFSTAALVAGVAANSRTFFGFIAYLSVRRHLAKKLLRVGNKATGCALLFFRRMALSLKH
jgi:hypothetical protein